MTLAITAMLAPNLVLAALLLLKYVKFGRASLSQGFLKTFFCATGEEKPPAILGEGPLSDFVNYACVGVDTFSLLLNLGVLLGSLSSYFTSDDLVPKGDGLCLAMYAAFAPVYRPVAISGFAAMVAVCDIVYWRSIENMPGPLRKAMGHSDHDPEKPPLQENSLTIACGGVMAALFFLWLAAGLTFIPLAGVHPYVPLGMLLLLVVLQLGIAELLTWGERTLDGRLARKHPGGLPANLAPVNVPSSLKIKAVILQVLCTVVMLATTGSFYATGDWAGSASTLAALLSAFAFDLTFDLNYAFSWPMALPAVSRIQFALAIGVLGLQITLSGFFRIYYGLELHEHGIETIREAFKEGDGGEGEGDPPCDRKTSEDKNCITDAPKRAVLLVHRILGVALMVAVQINASTLRFKLSRELKASKKVVLDLLDRGDVEEGGGVADPRQKVQAVKKDHVELQKAHEEHESRLVESKEKLKKANNELQAWKNTDQGALAKAACETVELTAGQILTSGKAGSFPGIVLLSFIEADVREAISVVGLGSNAKEPTSKLMGFFAGRKLPDVKTVILDGLGDFEMDDLAKFAAAVPNLEVLSMQGCTVKGKFGDFKALCKALSRSLKELNVSGCRDIEGEHTLSEVS